MILPTVVTTVLLVAHAPPVVMKPLRVSPSAMIGETSGADVISAAAFESDFFSEEKQPGNTASSADSR